MGASGCGEHTYQCLNEQGRRVGKKRRKRERRGGAQEEEDAEDAEEKEMEDEEEEEESSVGVLEGDIDDENKEREGGGKEWNRCVV